MQGVLCELPLNVYNDALIMSLLFFLLFFSLPFIYHLFSFFYINRFKRADWRIIVGFDIRTFFRQCSLFVCTLDIQAILVYFKPIFVYGTPSRFFAQIFTRIQNKIVLTVEKREITTHSSQGTGTSITIIFRHSLTCEIYLKYQKSLYSSSGDF